jgi:exosortase/archaeosortase family protein
MQAMRDGALAAAVLLAALAAADLPAVRAGFDALALGLAALAAPLLDLAGLPVIRSGAELRGLTGDWAVVVTEVCDGHGLVAAWLALCAALRGTGAARLRLALAGILAIQLFNLLRVLVLAVVLSAAPGRFEGVHLLVFPLLTVALFALLLAALGAVAPRRAALACGIGLGLAAAWAVVAAPAAGLLLAPPANGLLALFAGPDLAGLRPAEGGWVVATERLAALDPPSFLRAPIHPEDFAIALPALLAAALAVRGGLGWLAAGLALMPVALALGAVTAGWALPVAGTPGQVVILGPGGGVTLVPYAPPAEGAQALVRLAQNGIVHFNLLVLPLLVLALARRPAP